MGTKLQLRGRTKKLAMITTIGAVASMISIIKDQNRSIKVRNRVISTQDFYICDLEQFIMDNITGYEFPEMVGNRI